MVYWVPAIVRDPYLELEVVFGAIEKFTTPLPAPELPEVIVIHGTLLEAVQAQPVPAVTAALPVALAAPVDWMLTATE